MKKVALALSALFVFSMFAACTAPEQTNVAEQIPEQTPQIVYMECMDWGYYESLADLTSASDKIIVGTVAQQLPYIYYDIDADDPMPYTPLEITVSETIKGEPEDAVTIAQIGGLSEDGTRFIDAREHEPRLEVGQTYILFLNGADSHGNYHLMSPVFGYVKVDGDELMFEHNNTLFSGEVGNDPEKAIDEIKQAENIANTEE